MEIFFSPKIENLSIIEMLAQKSNIENISINYLSSGG